MPFAHSLTAERRNLLVLLLLSLVAFVVLFKPWIHGVDIVGYYSWLRSAVIDGNLNTANEYEFYGIGNRLRLLDTGYHANPYSVGSAVLWAPFFLLAHGATLIGGSLGADWVADGYGGQYVFAAGLGSVLYGLVALVLTYKIARTFFSSQVATLAVVAVWLASPLVFYHYSNPGMSHANDAFAFALLLYAWLRVRGNTGWAGHALLGAAAGLCALVRYQNAILVVFPLADIAWRTWQARLRLGTRHAIRQGLYQVLAFSAAWWLVFLPQLIAWRTVFGAWFVLNPYESASGGGFSFLQTHIPDLLFSPNRGLYVWTPLLLFATAGWAFLGKRDRRLTAFIVFNFALQLLLLGWWSGWAGGAAFGQRFFVNLVPGFALGLAALLDLLLPRIKFRWLVLGCSLFIAWNGLLLVRYVLGDVPRSGYVPFDQLIIGQFTVVPRYFGRIIEILLTRS